MIHWVVTTLVILIGLAFLVMAGVFVAVALGGDGRTTHRLDKRSKLCPGSWYGDYFRIATERGIEPGWFDAHDKWVTNDRDADARILGMLGFDTRKMQDAVRLPPA